jgi:hypothetical protein
MDTITQTDVGPDLATRLRRGARWTSAATAVSGIAFLASAMAALTGGVTVAGAGGPGVALAADADPRQLGWVLAAASALVAIAMAWLRRQVRGVADGTVAAGWTRARAGAAVASAVVAVTVLASVCGAMLLAVAGYLPMLLVGALFSADLRDGLAMVAEPAVLAQVAVVAVALTTVVAALAALDALRGSQPLPGRLQPAAAARWGRTAATVAIVVPLLYAFTRVVWVLGWPLGIDVDAFDAAGGDLRSGLALAAGATLGAALTTGLVRPWGERFWDWVPVLGGRVVPVRLAVVPASIVAALLLPAGVSMINVAIGGGGIVTVLSDLTTNWAAIGATFLWPLWSLALAAATLAYALRRRLSVPGRTVEE